MAKKVLTIRFDESIEKELEDIAIAKKTHKTTLIRKIVEQYIKNYNL